jgi:hypothetical protein
MADGIIGDVKKKVNGITAKAETVDDPMIWVSNKTVPSGRPSNLPVQGGRETMSLTQMQAALMAAGANRDPGYADVASKLIKGGFMPESYANIPQYAANGLGNAVNLYQSYLTAGGAESFDSWFNGYVSSAPGDDGTGGRGGGGGYAGPVTTTSVSITDENTAEALLDRYARDLLGRGLTKQETEKYIRQFNRAEAEAPQVSVSAGTGATRSSTTTTAASKEELLREVISKNPDYAKFQVDTTIMDLLMDDIRKGQEVING